MTEWRLREAGVDLVAVDTAHGHTKGVLDRISWIKQKYPNLDVMGRRSHG